MVLRVEAVENRLLRLETVISELIRLASVDPEVFLENLSEMWRIERGLEVGAGLLFDIGTHILVAHFGITPQEYRDIFEGLARQKVISRSLADRLRGFAGFRNILVHNYMDLDPSRVLANLERAPKDFSQFAREIREWLEGRPA